MISQDPGPKGPGQNKKKEKESCKRQATSTKLQAPAGLNSDTIKMYTQLRKK